KVVMPELPALQPSMKLATGDFGLGIPSLPVGFTLQVSATAQMSQITTFVKDKLRVIGYVPAGTVDANDLFGYYVDKFGTPTAGANIHVAVKLVSTNGQAGVRVSEKVLVS